MVCISCESEPGQSLSGVITHLTAVCCIQVYIYCFIKKLKDILRRKHVSGLS
jgi:hypothetical protein